MYIYIYTYIDRERYTYTYIYIYIYIWDPCPFGLLRILTVAHIRSSVGDPGYFEVDSEARL